jgi:serine/threonine protein kinase
MAEAGRSFDEPEIWLYFSQILDGLRGMHASRILHRDIKPANVLVSGAVQRVAGSTCTSGICYTHTGRRCSEHMAVQQLHCAGHRGLPHYCCTSS